MRIKPGYGSDSGKGSFITINKIKEYDSPYFLKVLAGPFVFKPFWYQTVIEDDDSIKYRAKLLYDNNDDNSILKILAMLEQQYYSSIGNELPSRPAFQIRDTPFVVAINKATDELGLWQISWTINDQLKKLQKESFSNDVKDNEGRIHTVINDEVLQNGPVFLYTLKIVKTHKESDSSWRGTIYQVTPIQHEKYIGKIRKDWLDEVTGEWNFPSEIADSMFTPKESECISAKEDEVIENQEYLVEGQSSKELLDTLISFPINTKATFDNRLVYDPKLIEFIKASFRDDPLKLSIFYDESSNAKSTAPVGSSDTANFKGTAVDSSSNNFQSSEGSTIEASEDSAAQSLESSSVSAMDKLKAMADNEDW